MKKKIYEILRAMISVIIRAEVINAVNMRCIENASC